MIVSSEKQTLYGFRRVSTQRDRIFYRKFSDFYTKVFNGLDKLLCNFSHHVTKCFERFVFQVSK
jgi:hypothetical protein